MHSPFTVFGVCTFHSERPGPPSQVSILVTSISSLFVVIKEPDGDTVGLITCYNGRCSSEYVSDTSITDVSGCGIVKGLIG